MKNALIAAIVALALVGPVSAQDLHRPWEFNAPSASFPVFFSSSIRLDIPLNDFMKRHWFASPGPGVYSGNRPTFWREWESLASCWIDTTRNRPGNRDYNADLRDFLLRVPMDAEGYVYSDSSTMGWPIPDPSRIAAHARRWDWDDSETGNSGWKLVGGGTTTVGEGAWKVILTEPDACIETGDLKLDALQSPLMIVRISASRAGTGAIEWTTDEEPDWNSKNRIEFSVGTATPAPVFALQMSRHPGWRGTITALRVRPLVSIPEDGIEAAFDHIECAYDTRHAVNNTSFILACRRYYLWTGDDEFLKLNMGRIRAAANYLRTNLRGDADGMVTIPYWGHDGTSGVSPKRRPGFGQGGDYWDILPIGHKSLPLNAYYVAALQAMADLESCAQTLKIRSNPYGQSADTFTAKAKAVAKKAGAFFWDDRKQRFIGCEDATGKRHDYGFVDLNLQALYYGLGDKSQAESIFSWLDGERKIEGDTSTGEDIYHWKFAPRSTTLRNTDWYVWTWGDMSKVPFGSQLQDGGAAAHTSFFDLIARIKHKSPDDAYARLTEIINWYSEVWEAGGYRSYYTGNGKGTLQGNGKLGSLAIDAEFVETTLVPMTFLYGFLGIDATREGLMIDPKLPRALQYAGVQRLTYHSVELTILATHGKITVKCTKNRDNKSFKLAGRTVTGTFERTVEASYALLSPVR